MKKWLVYVAVISLSFGFVFADDVEEETEIDSSFVNIYLEVGFEYSFKFYDDDNKTREEFISLYFNTSDIIDINKRTRFLPTVEMAIHYGLADYQKLGFSMQLGLGYEFDNGLLIRSSRIRIEPTIGLGALPVNYRPKINFGTILGFRIGVYFGNFGYYLGVKEYLIDGEDINTIFSAGVKWSFR